MSHGPTADAPRPGFFGWWQRSPLYLRILIGLILGVIAGVLLGERAGSLEVPAKLILRVLGTLAPPLILVAVVQAIMNADVRGKIAGRLASLLILNTLVAIVIGLLVANVVRPGKFATLQPEEKPALSQQETDPQRRIVLETLEKYNYRPTEPKKDILAQFLDNVPRSFFGPLTENNVIGVILIAVAFGIALRDHRDTPLRSVKDVVQIAMDTLIKVLHWVIQVVPIGVFGIVASIVGVKGFQPFLSLGMFIVAVILALLLQAGYYLARVRFGSWVRPMDLLRGCRDALVLAFSTASSTITMPVTYECLKDRVGLRARSAGMGALVGANFNNDGTALYEAMSALFIAQMLGQELTLPQQLMVVITSVLASVGAAGIPEAGLVTMTLVFTAVGLDTRYIALLLTVDWFLDRCRTAINVMGDMNVSSLLDGKTPKTPQEARDELGVPAEEAAAQAMDAETV
jgi:Na+/H+-dicarboxylate symporter